MIKTLTANRNHFFFKGDLLCKNHFYKLFEHSCVAAVCENNQPIMLKIHQLIFLIKPINPEQSLQTSCFRFSLFTSPRGKSPAHLWHTLCPISINTALSEKMRSAITGVIYTVSTKEALRVLFWDALMNIGVAIISPHLSRGHCG